MVLVYLNAKKLLLQARVYIRNLTDSDMLFALCPFYFRLTKTGMERMHRLSHIHSEVSVADTTKKKKERESGEGNNVGKGIKPVRSRSSECTRSSLYMPVAIG